MIRAVFMTTLLALVSHSALAAKPHPPGTLVLVMAVEIGKRGDIIATGEDGILGMLHANGIADEDIADGSVVFGFIYCCGGKVSRDTAYGFYVPTGVQVAVGDVVEVSLGRTVSKKERKRGERGTVNRALQVRDSFENETGSCRWDPEDDRLWMRVLYCEWMPDEGWQYRDGLSKGWYKLQTDTN